MIIHCGQPMKHGYPENDIDPDKEMTPIIILKKLKKLNVITRVGARV